MWNQKAFNTLCLTLFFFSTSSIAASTQKKISSQIDLISSVQVAQTDSQIDVGIYIQLPHGWHTYWKNPGDVGQAPQIKWKIPSSLKKGLIQWPLPQRIPYEKWTNFGYHEHVLLKRSLSIPKNYKQKEIPIQAKINWIICKSVCVPFSKNVKLNIPISNKEKSHKNHSQLFKKFKYPKPSSITGQIKKINGHYQVQLKSTDSIKIIDFFPQSFLSSNRPLIKKEIEGFHTVQYKGEVLKKNLEKFSSLVVYKKDRKIESQELIIKPSLQISLILFLLMAFVGGVILNFMPCVLPVVFLKFYSTLSTPRHQLMTSSLAYSLGIISSFLGLALIIQTLKTGSEHIGWGFQMQSPSFVTFLIFFFAFITLGFLGLFPMPRFKNSSQNSHPIIKNFASGFLASTAASPCTAPFMGIAIGYAFTQSILEVALVFSSLGLGMASPYIILSLFPQWLKYLPTPGKWSQTFKKAMAIPLLGTILWLINILSHLDNGWILPIIVSLSGFTLAFWLKKNLRMSQFIFIFVVFISSTLALFPMAFSHFMHKPQEMMMAQKEIPFSIFNLHQQLKKDRPLLLYFTAEWCITCKVNEWTTLKHQKVQTFLHQNNISVMKGDWTVRNPEISKILSQYGRASVPFMIFFPNKNEQEIILPTVLTPKIFIDTLSAHSL